MPNQISVLLVDDEESFRHMLGLTLSKKGFKVWTASSAQEALSIIQDNKTLDICITDIRMPGMDGLAFIEEALDLPTAPTFLAMSAYGDETLAIEALKRGAFDYLNKPFEASDLSLRLKLIAEKQQSSSASATSPSQASLPKPPSSLKHIIYKSHIMHRTLETVAKVSSFPTTVLITGETGTGKERVAGALHHESGRSRGPFVAVNCGALPENLLESELFGHVRGAFTDAHQHKEGLFSKAHGGTLFLDEVAELPIPLQVKLLRVLVEQEIRPVGSTQTISVDVRVVAATSRDLKEQVSNKCFREDLYYRLAVVSIHLPPLRERREDISILADHFAEKIALRLKLPPPHITDSAMNILQTYHWPGNVRELENAIERAIVLSDGHERLTLADLDDRFDTEPESEPLLEHWVTQLPDLDTKKAFYSVERILIQDALKRTKGHRTEAARLLNISQRSLLYKLKDYGLK